MNMGRRGEIMGRVQRTMNPKGRVRKTDGTVSQGTPVLEDGHYGRGFLYGWALGPYPTRAEFDEAVRVLRGSCGVAAGPAREPGEVICGVESKS